MCIDIPDFQVYLFRRKSKDLLKTHLKGKFGFRRILHPLTSAGRAPNGKEWCRIVEGVGEIRFWNGSVINLCHCNHESDVENYLSSEMNALLIDEVSAFTPEMYRKLRGRTRWDIEMDVNEVWRDRLPLIVLASNPGGQCHLYLKEGFYDVAPPETEFRAADDDGGKLRIFIPAKIADNPHIDQEQYRKTLEGLPTEALVRMYRDGDMSVIEGAFFKTFCADHVVEPFAIPDYWTRFRAIDWGFEHDFVCLWFAVSDGSIEGIEADELICYREWIVAGASTQEQALGVLEHTRPDEDIRYTVLDPSAYGKRNHGVRNGPTMADEYREHGLVCRRADNSRIVGWQQCQLRFKHNRVKIFDTCRGLLRALPMMQHAKLDPEDMEKVSGDDPVDAFRYGLMSRPWTATKPEPEDNRLTASAWLKAHGIKLQEFEKAIEQAKT